MSLWVKLQHKLPLRFSTNFFGALCACKTPWFKNALIRRFMKVYPVNFTEALTQNLDDYENFNAFFMRKLKPSARPLAAEPALISPVDGFVSSMGIIKENLIFQAKNHDFTLQALLGKNDWASRFINGAYATLYLSPSDYHRVHTPLDATLKAMQLIPGDLYSVNPETVEHCPNLFARNERLVTLFDTPHGPMAIILVGALNVGSMFTAWHGPVHSNVVQTWEGQDISLKRGDEVGGFMMGSTVIILFAKNTVQWDDVKPQSAVKLGQALGVVV